MNSDVVCLQTGDSAVDAAQKMRDEDIGFLPVCNDDGKAVGTVTDRDIVIRAVAEAHCDAKAEQIMTRDVVSCQADDNLDRAIELMETHEISRILVCDADGKPAGVISLGDLSHQDEDEAGEVLAEVKSGVEARH